MHFFQYKALIKARIPRVACTKCELTRQVAVPWARKNSGFSQVMEAFIVALCKEMPVLAVARLLNISDDRVWRVLDHYVDKAREQEDFSQVRRISADERSVHKGQTYLTMFCDADERRLLFAVPGKDAKTFKAFTADLQAHGGDASNITDVSLDLGLAYQKGARDHCPNAQVSFDPFHVVALANKALDQVRRAEAKSESDLKGIRWGTLKDCQKWNLRQINDMHWLQRSGLKTARAWRLKEKLRDGFVKGHDIETVKALLLAWISWGRRCRLFPFKRLAGTIRKHFDAILGHLRSGLNNGFAEAIDGRIPAAKVRARGYATNRHIITISYLICGKLKHLPENPWQQPLVASH